MNCKFLCQVRRGQKQKMYETVQSIAHLILHATLQPLDGAEYSTEALAFLQFT